MRTIAYWLSLLMILMVPWATFIVLPGLGTSSRFMGLIAAAFWLLTILVTGRIRKIGLFHVLIFLFFLWNAIALMWSTDPDRALTQTITYVQMAILSLIIWDLYTTPTAIRAGLQAYVLGLTVPIVVTISRFIDSMQTEYALYGRYSLSGSNPNTTAILLAMGIPLAWYLASSPGQGRLAKVLRWVNYAFIPLILYSMMLTATRFAVIMAIPALIFALATLTRLKLGLRIVMFATILVGLIVLASAIPQATFDRLSTIDDEIRAGDLNDRTELWGNAFDLWIERPVFGIGTAGFNKAVEPIYGRQRAVHNSFIAVLAELGLIGLGLFGAIVTMAVYLAWRLPGRMDTWFWLTVLMTWALGNFALTWVYSKPTWILLTLLATSASLAYQSDKPRPDAELSRARSLVPNVSYQTLQPTREPNPSD